MASGTACKIWPQGKDLIKILLRTLKNVRPAWKILTARQKRLLRILRSNHSHLDKAQHREVCFWKNCRCCFVVKEWTPIRIIENPHSFKENFIGKSTRSLDQKGRRQFKMEKKKKKSLLVSNFLWARSRLGGLFNCKARQFLMKKEDWLRGQLDPRAGSQVSGLGTYSREKNQDLVEN